MTKTVEPKVTWDDVAQQMADDTHKTVDDPAVSAAIRAFRNTRLSPSFVLATWRSMASWESE